MRGSDILADMLIAYGVETVFGVPGDTNVPFYEALQERSRGLPTTVFVLAGESLPFGDVML